MAEKIERVYGEYFDDLMRARMLRDGTSYVRRAIVRRGGYLVRCYIEPDPYSTNKVYYYHQRTDGRVARSYGSVEKRWVHEVGEVVRRVEVTA